MNIDSEQVSIIIPSLNSPIIDRVIIAIEEQDGADQISEIVVVGKDEARLIPENGRVKLIDTGIPVPAGTARNLGIEATTAVLLIFLDSDCIPQPGWLREHFLAHETGHTVIGGSVLPDGENYWALSYNLTMFHEYFSTTSPGVRAFLPTLNLSVERHVIEDVGLLNESLPRSQDLDWTTRMNATGYQPFFWPSAIIQHQHNRTTWQKVWRDCARSGQYARQARLIHQDTLNTPSILRSRHMLLWLSPLIAGGVTIRMVLKSLTVFMRSWRTVPVIYLSKIAWCWGGSRLQEIK